MKQLLVALPLISLTACASIVEGTSQEIAINTTPTGADCELVREGKVIGKVSNTPGSVKIQKTKHDITILCDKPGYQQTSFVNHSGVAGGTFGNIILGGGVGWAVDSARGADNKYDTPVNISMPSQLAATPTEAQPAQSYGVQVTPVAAATPASANVTPILQQPESQAPVAAPQPQPAQPQAVSAPAPSAQPSALTKYLNDGKSQ